MESPRWLDSAASRSLYPWASAWSGRAEMDRRMETTGVTDQWTSSGVTGAVSAATASKALRRVSWAVSSKRSADLSRMAAR